MPTSILQAFALASRPMTDRSESSLSVAKDAEPEQSC